jgi:hypothetical protein
VAELERARFMEFGPDGTLFVSRPHIGRSGVPGWDSDGFFEEIATFVKGHGRVHAMVSCDGWLWFAERDVFRSALRTATAWRTSSRR